MQATSPSAGRGICRWISLGDPTEEVVSAPSGFDALRKYPEVIEDTKATLLATPSCRTSGWRLGLEQPLKWATWP